MDINSKNSVLFLVQIDHLSGECVANAIECFYEAGASNVQVIPSVTKKNRPSYIFLIDCRAGREDVIELVIINELGTGGWHQMDTVHRYLRNRIIKRRIEIRNNDQKFEYTIEGKEFDSDTIRPEYENVSELKNIIKKRLHQSVGFNTLYNQVLAVLLDEEKDSIEIR